MKSWLKTQPLENEDHGIQSHHFMEIGGGTMETVTDFIFGGSKITADGHSSHEIKRGFLLGRKPMTNLDSVYLCQKKVHIIKATVFPVVMYGCES